MTQYCEALILSGSLFEYFICFPLWEYSANPVWSFYYIGKGNSSLQQNLIAAKEKVKSSRKATKC